MAFVPPPELVVFETDHWRINQRVDCPFPGYLMLGAKNQSVIELSDASPSALSELGHLQGRATAILQDQFSAAKVYIGRFGHDSGHTVHFHIIPVYPWLFDRYHSSAAYHDVEPNPDGADMMKFIWREFCENECCEVLPGPPMEESLALLRQQFERISFD